jgi:hypothetical protein
VQYFIIGSVPSGFLVLGVALLYKSWGTLGFGDLDVLLSDIPTLTNQNSAFFHFLRFNQGATATQQSNGNILLFTKNQELVNLNIFYQRLNKNANSNYDVVTTTSFPHMLFCFNIFGVDETGRVVDLNGSRLF